MTGKREVPPKGGLPTKRDFALPFASTQVLFARRPAKSRCVPASQVSRRRSLVSREQQRVVKRCAFHHFPWGLIVSWELCADRKIGASLHQQFDDRKPSVLSLCRRVEYRCLAANANFVQHRCCIDISAAIQQ